MGVVNPPRLKPTVIQLLCDGTVQRVTADTTLWAQRPQFSSDSENGAATIVFIGYENDNGTLPADLDKTNCLASLMTGGSYIPPFAQLHSDMGQQFQLSRFCYKGPVGSYIHLDRVVQQ